jgi:hypothetical protein
MRLWIIAAAASAMVFHSSALAETIAVPEGIVMERPGVRWHPTPEGVLAEKPTDSGNLTGLAARIAGPTLPLLGRGYNGLSAEMRGTCLVGDQVASGTDAKKVDYSLHMAGSSDDYRRSVNMSAAASFGTGTWSTDASVSYFKSSARSRYVDHLVVRVLVQGPVLSFENVHLTADAKRMVRRPLDFYRMCGNRYVRSLSLGGEFTAVVDIETNTEEERSELRATLSVIAKGYGSANAAYAEAMQRISRSYSKNVRILRNGTGEAIPNPDIDTVLKYSLDFPTKINAVTGVPVALETADYRTVDPAVEIYSAQEIVVEMMSRKYGQIFEWLGDLDYYARKRNDRVFYPLLSEDALRRAQDTLRDAALKAELAFNGCIENPTRNCGATSFPDIDIDAPRPARQASLNPKSGSSQYVGFAGPGERKTVVILGDWSAWDNGEHLWWPPTRCCFSIEIAGEVGPPTSVSYTGPITFSGPARVSVRIGDSTYEDNRGRGLVAVVY